MDIENAEENIDLLRKEYITLLRKKSSAELTDGTISVLIRNDDPDFQETFDALVEKNDFRNLFKRIKEHNPHVIYWPRDYPNTMNMVYIFLTKKDSELDKTMEYLENNSFFLDIFNPKNKQVKYYELKGRINKLKN